MKKAALLLLLPLALALTACPASMKKARKAPTAAKTAADPSKVQSFYIEGVYAYAEGKTETAMAAWKKALALDPAHKPTLEAMAEAREKMKAVKKLKK